jgi:hypothetical protein
LEDGGLTALVAPDGRLAALAVPHERERILQPKQVFC